jgi:uncharacterized protein DUF4397
MRRLLPVSLLCLAAGALNACQPEEVILTENIPTAGVRFIHAVPDTGAMDFRPVDIVENSQFYGVAFRPTNAAFYKNARAGSRHYRIFMSADLSLPSAQQQAQASTVVKDTTFTLEAGHNYTFILWGYARAGSPLGPAMKLDIIDDNPGDPGASVALRIVNTAGLGAIDGKQYPAAGAPPAAATWANVAPQSASAYISTTPASIRYNVTPAGGGAALFADPTALAGVAATVDIEAQPGTTIAGSAVSGFVFPRSVAGSKAPQGTISGVNYGLPGIMFIWDRRPPRAPGL